jgi:exosortase
VTPRINPTATLVVAALAALWLPVVWLLGAQWSNYEQYRYGWVVPFLCTVFAWRRLHDASTAAAAAVSRATHRRLPSIEWILFGTLALFLTPALVLQHANPLWRFASYSLVVVACALTLLLLRRCFGSDAMRRCVFPVLFFLLAVPWPTPVEAFVVEKLTRVNVAIVIEALQLFGIPAVAHGNVIQVPAGFVGVEEACSGIRSMQAVLMLSLAFGEWYRLQVKSRASVVGAGILIAFALNAARTTTLSALTASGGSDLAARYHDLTGVVLLLGCFTLVWWVSARSSARQATRIEKATARLLFTGLGTKFAIALLLVSIGSVAATELWFRSHERRDASVVEWNIRFPEDAPGFRTLPISDYVRAQLLFDRAATASWESRGMRWTCFYFRWFPATAVRDRIRSQLAKSHRPEICLPSGGRALIGERAPITVLVVKDAVPFRVLEFSEGGSPLFVFYAALEDGTDSKAANMRESHRSRWRAAWHGNRGLGQRVLEIIVARAPDFPTAEAAFRDQLSSLVTPVTP